MRVSDTCKKHYAAHLTLICVDFRTYLSAWLLTCHSPNCLFSYISLSTPFPPLPLIPFPSRSLPPSSPSLCSVLMSGGAPGKRRRGCIPGGLFGVLLSVDQHAPRRADRQLRALGLFKTRAQSSTKHLSFQTLHWHVPNHSQKQRRKRIKQKKWCVFFSVFAFACVCKVEVMFCKLWD